MDLSQERQSTTHSPIFYPFIQPLLHDTSLVPQFASNRFLCTLRITFLQLFK